MPLVKSSNKRPMATAPPTVVLPTEYIEPVTDFNDMKVLIHGEKKIGKTTLAQRLDDDGKVLFLQFDPPQSSYRRIEENFVAQPWSRFLAYVSALESAAKTKKLPYRRVVVDGVAAWYKKCMDAVCTRMAIQHPADEGYGKGWDAVKTEFTKCVDRMLALPCGVWFLAHSVWKEVETRDAEKVEKLVPLLSGSCEELLNGKVDGWFAYDYVGKRRVLFVQGNERIGAGHRMHDPESGAHHFRVGGPEGPPVEEIDMGTSPREGYDNLLLAFANEQSYANIAELEEGGSTPVVKKTKLRTKPR